MSSSKDEAHKSVATVRRVCLLTFPESELLDAVGPLEVFAKANDLAGRDLYSIDLVAPRLGPLRMSSGLQLAAGTSLEDDLGTVDTLLIGGGDGTRQRASDCQVQAWLTRHAKAARRVGSVCTGAYVLAAGGFLDGRRATTHWRRCGEFSRLFPRVLLEPDAIFVRDGCFVTSAGITAGIDLALALVEEDQGRELAFAVARQLVVLARRAGGQSQFSAALLANPPGGPRFDELRRWITENLDHDLTVETLARRASMTPRSFARHFKRETGLTPGAYVQAARIDAARQALEDGCEPLKEIAGRLGFGHEETFRRAFLKCLKVNPNDYRKRWAALDTEADAGGCSQRQLRKGAIG